MSDSLPIVLEPAEPKTEPNRIDVAKALKLRLQGNTCEEIGAVFGVSRQAVSQALANFQTVISDLHPGELSAYNEERRNLLTRAEWTLLESCLDKDAIQKAPLASRVMAFGVMFDKRRLEENKSTSNVGVLSKIITNSDDGLFK